MLRFRFHSGALVVGERETRDELGRGFEFTLAKGCSSWRERSSNRIASRGARRSVAFRLWEEVES